MLPTIDKSGILSYSIFQDQADNTTYIVKCDNDLIDYAIKGDMTELMNTTISYNDYLSDNNEYSKESIRKEILSFCEIEEKKGNLIILKYVGTKKQ